MLLLFEIWWCPQVFQVITYGIYFWAALRFELRALNFLRWHFIAWAMSLAFFAVVILEIGLAFLPSPAYSSTLLFYASLLLLLGDRCSPQHPAFFFWDGVLQTFVQAGLEHDSLHLRLPYILGWKVLHHHTQVLVRVGSCKLFFCLGLPQTVILPISASQVTRVTSLSY
jgi:hypothetical protein